MPTTERDAQAITYLARRLREETRGAGPWDEAGTYAEVAKMVGQNLAISIERATRHAADPTAKTPGAIRRPFTPLAPKDELLHPPRADEVCPHHPAYRAANCGGCNADRLAAETPPPRSWEPGDATTGADACRAAVRAVRG